MKHQGIPMRELYPHNYLILLRHLKWLTLFSCLLLLTGCTGKPSAPPLSSLPASTPTDPGNIHLTDVTKASGINWIHNACRSGRKLLPETVGGGGGFIDYNNDGLLDIVLINGAPLPGYKGSTPHLALYRNNGNGTFTDVTKESGLDMKEYGLGLAVGDYDNKGWPDLYITTLGHNRLFHNDHGHFSDVTSKAGVAMSGFSTAAAWIDYDHCGRLDLFVARYVEWSPATDLPCGPPNARQYCPPNQYKGARPALFRNRGDGTFEDVSAKSGIFGNPSKTLSVNLCDFNNDGWPDLYLANDTEPDVLLVNNRNRTFTNQALSAGLAMGTDGTPTGSMGVDIATPFSDGRWSIAVGTFAQQETSLFVNPPNSPSGSILFENRKQEVGIAETTRKVTTFGLIFADVDLDGWPDLLELNGHIDDDPSMSVGGEHVPYKQIPTLFQNQQNGTFKNVAALAGLTTPFIGRGLAAGDFDNDGRLDFLVFENGGPVRLLHNDTPPAGNWIGIQLIGSKSPRDGTGAVVTVSSAGWQQSRFVSTARSYLSACDSRVHFGLGHHSIDTLTIRWPSGIVTTIPSPKINQYLKINESS